MVQYVVLMIHVFGKGSFAGVVLIIHCLGKGLFGKGSLVGCLDNPLV